MVVRLHPRSSDGSDRRVDGVIHICDIVWFCGWKQFRAGVFFYCFMSSGILLEGNDWDPTNVLLVISVYNLFLLCFLCVCLRSVSCVANVFGVSELSILS